MKNLYTLVLLLFITNFVSAQSRYFYSNSNGQCGQNSTHYQSQVTTNHCNGSNWQYQNHHPHQNHYNGSACCNHQTMSYGQHANGYCNRQLSQEAFNRFYSHMKRNTSFDNNRLEMVRNFVRFNHLNTRQVKQLMLAFSFDRSRLECAKIAFHNTCDKQNYYLLSDALTFFSSRRALTDFIQNPV